uniref:Uncharacterized protein n=1 Tax=Anguilla anguilla TaxID=7936 RepID=A0A0E9X3K1_ANGAN
MCSFCLRLRSVFIYLVKMSSLGIFFLLFLTVCILFYFITSGKQQQSPVTFTFMNIIFHLLSKRCSFAVPHGC